MLLPAPAPGIGATDAHLRVPTDDGEQAGRGATALMESRRG